MKEKRRDNKGRVLHTGETQETKGKYKGRYTYRYTDLNGKRRAVYSWKLTKTDVVSKGRPGDKSLREKEEEIKELLRRGVNDSDMTIVDMFTRFLKLKTGIEHNTYTTYNTVKNYLLKHPFGQRKMKDVTKSQAKEFIIQAKNEGYAYNTVNGMKKKIKAAFQMAIEDCLLLRNPFDFSTSSVIINDSEEIISLSAEDEKRFLDFVKKHSYYSKFYYAFYVLLKTGLRISEFCALTLKDIDFTSKILRINKQLEYVQDKNTGKMKFVVSPPKTEKGIRDIPMSDDVIQAFKRIIQQRKQPKVVKMIDGYSDFLFYTRNGNPVVAPAWQKRLRSIRTQYNKNHEVPLPVITPHILRHTYCTKMAKLRVTPKTLQYLMGHSDIIITLNYYTHIGFEDAKEELEAISII